MITDFFKSLNEIDNNFNTKIGQIGQELIFENKYDTYYQDNLIPKLKSSSVKFEFQTLKVHIVCLNLIIKHKNCIIIEDLQLNDLCWDTKQRFLFEKYTDLITEIKSNAKQILSRPYLTIGPVLPFEPYITL